MARAAKNKRNNNKLIAVEGGVVLGTDPDLIQAEQAESKSGESKDDYDSKGNDDGDDYDAKSSHK